MSNPKDTETFGAVSELHYPKAPQSVDETGINAIFLVELLSKILYLNGQMRMAEISSHTRLSFSVLEPLLDFMRAEKLCEIIRQGDTSATITYSMTEFGRSRAQDFLQKNQYCGVAPVTLEDYTRQVKLQSVHQMKVAKETVFEAFTGIVLRESILDQFGAAINSGRAIFVYGPPGAGKSFTAEHLTNLMSGNPLIPHAILVDNQIIQVFDPLIHIPVLEKPVSSPLERRITYDTRWIPCQRPVVITGGELTLSMLNLDFDQNSRFYQAPPQIKANNGLLIVDDLGRQLVSPQQLMNRWIVPLDRSVDYQALHTGTKFMVPFDMIVVFSTNLQPSALADEAFLRRLGYKIYLGPLHEDEYLGICQQVCQSYSVPFSSAGFRYLVDELHKEHKKPLLACIPRDLIGQVRDYALYQGLQPNMDKDMLDWAWNNYYARDVVIE